MLDRSLTVKIECSHFNCHSCQSPPRKLGFTPASTPSCSSPILLMSAAPVKYAPQYVPPSHVPPSAPIARAINSWEVGLFDCFCAPVHACSALFFPCLNAAYTAHYIRQSAVLTGLFFFVIQLTSVLFAVIPPENDHKLTPFIVASLYCSGALTIAVMALRHAVRMYYHIPGSFAHDCCAAVFCSCCALTQMSTHTELFKDRLSTLPAYDRRFEGESEWLRSEGDHVDDSRVEEGYHALK